MNLADIRKSQGLSQRVLGERIGVDASTIQRAETMHPSAKLATYISCAKVLDVSLSEIFSENLSLEETLLIDVFRALSSEQRSKTIELLRSFAGLCQSNS